MMNATLPFYKLLMLAVAGSWLFACSPIEEVKGEDDTLLATVFSKSLYLSELDGMIPESGGATDSMLFINAFVERWVRETLLMHEAEKHISQDLNIDQLVKDYRASLIRYNYEKLLVELQLDSTVSRPFLDQYYREHESQFPLEHTIVRCYFIKFPLEAPEQEEFKKWWEDDSEEAFKNMLEYCSHFADIYMLKDSSWYKRDEIMALIPPGQLKNNDLTAGKSHTFSADSSLYFAKVFEVKAAGNQAPLGYVEDQISRLIIHQRKIKLLDDKKEEIYEREIRRNNVKIYTQ